MLPEQEIIWLYFYNYYYYYHYYYYYYYYWICFKKIKTTANENRLNKTKEINLQAKQKPVIAKLFDFIYLILT